MFRADLLLQDRLLESDTVAPRIGQYGPRQANMIASQGADLRFWVELRGFEPLTPSMRTRCATGLRYSPNGTAVSVANLAARSRRRQVPRGG